MKEVIRERLILPLAIPLGAFAVIAIVTIGFSRILLNVPHQVATAVAIGMALNVLVVASVFAARKRMSQTQFFVLTTVAIVPLALGGAVAVGVVPVKTTIHQGAEEVSQRLVLAAHNITFDKPTLETVAGKKTTLTFTNNDSGVAHNVAIFHGADATAANVFRGAVINGVKSVDYSLPALSAGSYFFHCDVHPNMTGTLNVEGVAPKAPTTKESSPPGEVTPQNSKGEIIAKNIAFTPVSLSFSSGSPILLDFHNEDAGIPHNVAIFRGKTPTGDPVFRGEVFAGVTTVTYRIPALQAGDYSFRCDVHPNMTGTIKAG